PGCSASSVGTVSISSVDASGEMMRSRADGTAPKAACAPCRASPMEGKIPTTARMWMLASEKHAAAQTGKNGSFSGENCRLSTTYNHRLRSGSRVLRRRGTAPLMHIAASPGGFDEQGNSQGPVEAVQGPRPEAVGQAHR